MENSMMKETIMSALNEQLEMLQAEMDNAVHSLGLVTLDRDAVDCSIYYERKDACIISREKVRLMQKIIDKVNTVCSSQMPMMARI